MKRNVDIPIRDLDGSEVKAGDKWLTVGTCSAQALVSLPDGEGTEKASRYRLAMRLVAGGTVDLSVDDLASIKMAVGKQFLPLVVGQVYQWADDDKPPGNGENPPG